MEIGKFFLREFSIDSNFKKSGGEAIVSKAWHPRLGQVAIKEWTNDAYKVDNEIKLLIQNCDHQNIIQFLGILMNNESNYIGYIMPYMSIGSLHDVIHNKAEKYDQKQISSWITQICCGLSHLHFKKIIHRDIKPSNVLLGKSYDDVKLSDLGIARSLKNITHVLTKRLGTELYTAPEIFKSEKYDFSADIYSLSITIWEILHRRHRILADFDLFFRKPFDHIKCSNIFEEYELLNNIYNGKRPELSNNLSKEISDLLMRCWHVDASKRPTINYVAGFFSKIKVVYTALQNVVNEYAPSFENLNVHNTKTITGKKFERLEKNVAQDNADSRNTQNKLTAVNTKASSNDESLVQILIKKLLAPNPFENSLEKQTILLLGGKNSNKVLILESNGQNWKQLNIKLPYTIDSHGAQFLNNNLYIFGGHNPIKKQLNLTYKLSKSLQWEKMANMDETRHSISNSNVILNNQIWVCGGHNGKKGLKSVEMYDPLANEWKYMKEMNQLRVNAGAAVVNGKIFCSGGWDGKNYLNSVEYYDPSSNVWTIICNMPQNIRGHGTVEMDGNFIVMGGIGDEYLNSVLALDTNDENAGWIKKPSMSIARFGFSTTKIDNKIFVCGGATAGDNIWKYGNSGEIFDGEVWRNGPKVPTLPLYAPAVVIPMEFARYLK